jgi:hypothetical protein
MPLDVVVGHAGDGSRHPELALCIMKEKVPIGWAVYSKEHCWQLVLAYSSSGNCIFTRILLNPVAHECFKYLYDYNRLIILESIKDK